MLVDILRNKYLGPLHLNRIQFLYYLKTNMHGKAILVDDEVFAIGSPNFDYRSFRYMHEIVLVGREPEVIRQLRQHIDESLKYCEPFSYEKWLNRPRIQLLVEWLLLPFRHLL
jgi:cardiolipin synthase